MINIMNSRKQKIKISYNAFIIIMLIFVNFIALSACASQYSNPNVVNNIKQTHIQKSSIKYYLYEVINNQEEYTRIKNLNLICDRSEIYANVNDEEKLHETYAQLRMQIIDKVKSWNDKNKSKLNISVVVKPNGCIIVTKITSRNNLSEYIKNGMINNLIDWIESQSLYSIPDNSTKYYILDIPLTL